MTLVVASLVGRGFGDDLIERVGMAWWRYFYERGLTATDGPEMLADLRACIRSTRANPEFRAAWTGIDHAALCRQIRLSPEQESLLDARVVSGEEGQKSLQLAPLALQSHPSTGESITQIHHIGIPLCKDDDERCFVTALVVHVMHKRFDLNESAIKMTHDQLREIIQDRHPSSREWRGADPQIGRLKRRYVSQPGRPALKYELLRETFKGKPGHPSVYEATGIEEFLKVAHEPTVCGPAAA
jgi:hypothetical protein